MKEVFAEPEAGHIIDCLIPGTDLSSINGETLAQIRLRYPKAERMTMADWCATKAARQETPIRWDEIGKDQYTDWLECLPPADYGLDHRAFLIGEPSDHSARTGQPRYQACVFAARRYWASSRPMTVAEFREIFGKPFTVEAA